MLINFIHIPGGTSIKEITNNSRTIVYNKNLSNQLVVIRNPIDRFISSVYYAIQKY